jgi:hypothetical protein
MWNVKNSFLILIASFIFGCAQTTTKVSQNSQEMKICRINIRGDYKDFSNCFSGTNPDGTFNVKPEILAQINFSQVLDKRVHYADFSRTQPKSSVHSSSVVGYILPNGKARDVIFFDNGPDYFNAGVARFIGANGKTGYINEALQVVIQPVHDFASPFDEGFAYFCDGCKSESDGSEHQKIVGGMWGKMAKNGKTLQGPASYEKFFSIKK